MCHFHFPGQSLQQSSPTGKGMQNAICKRIQNEGLSMSFIKFPDPKGPKIGIGPTIKVFGFAICFSPFRFVFSVCH